MKVKVKVTDKVMVLSGKDKGKTGKVSRVYRKQGKLTVEKLNMVVKHIKKSQSRPGERITFEAPMHTSKVIVICPQCEKPTRVGYTIIEKAGKSKKQRVCKKCKQALDSVKSVKSKK